MKTLRYTLVFALFAALMFQGCKKDPEQVEGGKVNLYITVSHHGYPIAHAVVFRKNGTLVFPGQDTTLYETRYVADANGRLTIENIGNGGKQMVLYAKGFDPAWDTTQITPVWGYQFVNITTVIGENKNVEVLIPVSE